MVMFNSFLYVYQRVAISVISPCFHWRSSHWSGPWDPWGSRAPCSEPPCTCCWTDGWSAGHRGGVGGCHFIWILAIKIWGYHISVDVNNKWLLVDVGLSHEQWLLKPGRMDDSHFILFFKSYLLYQHVGIISHVWLMLVNDFWYE
jgi:hypothetical protein